MIDKEFLIQLDSFIRNQLSNCGCLRNGSNDLEVCFGDLPWIKPHVNLEIMEGPYTFIIEAVTPNDLIESIPFVGEFFDDELATVLGQVAAEWERIMETRS